MGDSIYQLGLLWLVLELTGSNSVMGFVAMASYLPILMFGIFAGVLVDLLDRRILMMIADAARALVVLFIPILYFSAHLNIASIFAIAFFLTTFTAVFNPARDAIVPELVSQAYLLKANSLVQVSYYSAVLLGPALAAVVLGIVGLAHLFTIDALTFVLSFLAILVIKLPPGKAAPSASLGFKGHFFEIIGYIRHARRIRFLIGLTAINNFFIMGPAIVGTPIFIKHVLNEDAVGYAKVEACLGLGMVAGAILVNTIGQHISKPKMLLLAMVFDGLTLTLFYWCNSLVAFMFVIGFHAIGIPHIAVPRTSLIQQWVDRQRLGRVFSIVNMSVMGMTALSTGLVGVLSEYFSIRSIYGAFGLGGVLCGMVGWAHREFRSS